jgi:hypothetical protein
MKIIQSFLLAFFLIGNCYANEINLICSGVENFYSDKVGSKKLQDSIEIVFDDSTKKLISVNRTRLFGCFESGTDYTKSCDCKVTDSSISCLSESTNNNKNFKSAQTLKVNRATGILSFGETTVGENLIITRSGDFSCESFSKKKF